MHLHRIRTLLAELELDPPEGAAHLPHRIDALDRIDRWLPTIEEADPELWGRAQAVCERLEALNVALYQDLRDDIRRGREAGHLLRWVLAWQSTGIGGGADQANYDLLDDVVSGILQFGEPQVPATELTSDMVFYQPTPARHIFEMISRSGAGEGDVVIDLGSGLGHVPLLVAICTRAQAIGIELERSYVECAQQVAATLNLADVHFIQQDVRAADFSAGTVFYLYTPFKGAILRDVLDRLRSEASQRAIRVCTFGPCTATVAQESWLRACEAVEADRIAVFRSLPV